MQQIQKIENIFTENVKSPIFTQLADLYFTNRQYDYAHRVCRIGLDNDPENQEGKYILSKVHLVNNNIEKAEQLLQEIALVSPYNLSVFLLLIPAMESLKRSKKSIAIYVKKITVFYNEHHAIQAYSKYYCDIGPIKQTIKKKTAITKVRSKSLLIHQQLVTKTMYKLFVKQKKYHDAYEILQIMKQNKRNIKFVKIESARILKKIGNN